MDQVDQTAWRMQSSIMETPPSESQTPGRVTSALGASTQQDAHPLPEQITHMDLDRTADSTIASRFGTMLINTIPEERTLRSSSIQGASGNLIDANTGEDGSAQFFQEPDDFLAKYELELEFHAQHRLKLSDIHANPCLGHVHHSKYWRHTSPPDARSAPQGRACDRTRVTCLLLSCRTYVERWMNRETFSLL
jgi:hypothetical protein